MRRRWQHTQGIFIGLTMLWLSALSGAAVAATSPLVNGTVTSNGSTVASVSVSVVCTAAGGAQHTRNTTTSGTGHYSVSFPAGQCDDGSNVVVTASLGDGSSGQASGLMGDGGASQHVTLDISLTPTTALPEFGVLTGLIGLGGGAALISWLRRRAVQA